MTELLPCPFCGKAPRVIEATPNASPDFQIFCICEAEPIFSVPVKDRDRAILAWNTRTAPAKGCEAKGEHTCGTSHANTPSADRVREAVKAGREMMRQMMHALATGRGADYSEWEAACDKWDAVCEAALAPKEGKP